MDSNYIHKSFSKWLVYLILVIPFVAGCGHDEKYEDNSYANVKLQLQAAPGVLQQVSVTSIDIIITSPELTEPRIFKITDINPAENSARTSIRVPLVNSLNFSVKAFQGECPVLSGILENVQLTPNQTAPLVIRLSHVQIIIGVRSNQAQVNVGENYSAEVFIEDAPKIYSFTCELSFDENLLTPTNIIPGDFFGNDVVFLEESQLPRREPGKIAIGITLKGNATGICSSGTLFQLTFGTASPGDARINIIQNDKLILKTPFPEFSPIEPSRIVIREGTSVKIQ